MAKDIETIEVTRFPDRPGREEPEGKPGASRRHRPGAGMTGKRDAGSTWCKKLKIIFSFLSYAGSMVNERRRKRDALLQVASVQQGHFTARQAMRAGYSHQAQKYHVDQGDWERVGHGIFRLRAWPHSTDDHLVAWHLWSGGVAIVSHNSALALHDLGDVNPSRLHLTVPRGFRKRSDSVVLHRADVPDQDVDERQGFRVSRATRALVEAAVDKLSGELLAGAVADGIENGRTSVRRLREAAARLGATDEIEAAIAEATR